MKMSCKPISFHLVEREQSDNLIIWTYPTINEDLKLLILTTCFSDGLEAADLFYYRRQEKVWIYFEQFAVGDRRMTVVFTSHCFQPTLYKELCDAFLKKYISGSNEVELVKTYLKIFINDGVKLNVNSIGTFFNLKDIPWNTNLKGLIKTLGMEIILVYNALLLKRQILVYHPDVETLQESLESLTKLMALKNPEDFLDPLVGSAADLRKPSPFLLKGTTRSNILSQQNSFDLLVNLETQKISVSPKSKDFFQMTQLHKDIACSMVQLAEREQSESEINETITRKTLDVYKYLKTFENFTEGERYILVQSFETKKLNKNLAKFLTNLAVVENIKIVV